MRLPSWVMCSSFAFNRCANTLMTFAMACEFFCGSLRNADAASTIFMISSYAGPWFSLTDATSWSTTLCADRTISLLPAAVTSVEDAEGKDLPTATSTGAGPEEASTHAPPAIGGGGEAAPGTAGEASGGEKMAGVETAPTDCPPSG
eukprot:15472073-Alexandrium_andersonii.AAC.1